MLFILESFPDMTFTGLEFCLKNYVTLNHGFYFKKALEDVGYLDTVNYNFYAADGDVIMRLNECGWKSVALENCFSEHLCHKPKLRNRGVLSPSE